MTKTYIYTLILLLSIAQSGCDTSGPESPEPPLPPETYAEQIAPKLFTFDAEESGLGIKATIYAESREEARSILDKRIADGIQIPDHDAFHDHETIEDMKNGATTLHGIGTPFWVTDESPFNHTFAMQIAIDGRFPDLGNRYPTEMLTHYISQDAFNISCETIFMILRTRNASEAIAVTQFDVGVYNGAPGIVWNFQVNGVEQYPLPAWSSTALLPPYFF